MNNDISDPKVKLFLLDAMVNGLKTEIDTQKDRNMFALELAEDLSRNTLNGVFAMGDEEGILIEDVKSFPIGLIKVKCGMITFHMITPMEELDDAGKSVMARAVLGTVSFAFKWHKEKARQMPIPNENIINNPVEQSKDFDDDGFGMF